jgi:hypothetical protein
MNDALCAVEEIVLSVSAALALALSVVAAAVMAVTVVTNLHHTE